MKVSIQQSMDDLLQPATEREHQARLAGDSDQDGTGGGQPGAGEGEQASQHGVDVHAHGGSRNALPEAGAHVQERASTTFIRNR